MNNTTSLEPDSPSPVNPDSAPQGLSVVIPAFNEKDGIAEVIEQLKKDLAGITTQKEIIVVDDGSTDGTSQLLTTIQGIQVISHVKNKGYGASLKTGMKAASHEWICITDADGTYPNERIPDLLARMHDNDMVVGSRVGSGAKIPLIRKPAKWTLNQIANYLVKVKIPDLNSGLRIFKKQVANKFLNLLPDSFSFTTTITLAMLSNNYRVEYMPIQYHHRTGKSKIRPIHDTINFLQLIVRTILYFDPLRVFLPAGLMLIGTSCVLFLFRLAEGGGYAVTIPMFLLAGIQVLAIGMLADLIVKRMKL
ncbi:glycosyltransferase family 2 protein [Thermodesulfobacteriota bacterium]